MKQSRYVIIIGNVVTEEIKRKRGLSSANPATTRRILSLAEAWRIAGYNVTIIAPGATPSLVGHSKLFHGRVVEVLGDGAVIFAASIGLPMVSLIVSPISVLLEIMKVAKGAGGIVVAVNYMPEVVLSSVFVRGFFQWSLIADVEDICSPKLCGVRDGWRACARQYLGFMLLKYILAIADACIVPARRFMSHLAYARNLSVVIPTFRTVQQSRCGYVAKVLFSGLLIEDNGVRVFLDALRILDRNGVLPPTAFTICGYGPMADEVEKECKAFNNLDVRYLGFVDSAKFSEMLAQADVVLALQDPRGGNASRKVPSKVFEALSYGAAVLGTEVGDFAKGGIPGVILLEEYSGGGLARTLKSLSLSTLREHQVKGAAYALAELSHDAASVRLTAIHEKIVERGNVI